VSGHDGTPPEKLVAHRHRCIPWLLSRGRARLRKQRDLLHASHDVRLEQRCPAGSPRGMDSHNGRTRVAVRVDSGLCYGHLLPWLWLLQAGQFQSLHDGTKRARCDRRRLCAAHTPLVPRRPLRGAASMLDHAKASPPQAATPRLLRNLRLRPAGNAGAVSGMRERSLNRVMRPFTINRTLIITAAIALPLALGLMLYTPVGDREHRGRDLPGRPHAHRRGGEGLLRPQCAVGPLLDGSPPEKRDAGL
jgi:hypothetical protein